MAARGGSSARVAQRGFGQMTAAEGAVALGRLLGAGAAQVGVVPMNARQWIEFYPQIAASPRLSPLVQRSARRRAGRGDAALLEALRAAAPSRRLALVEQTLCEHVAHVMRLDPAQIEPDTPLKGLGIDSLMGLELRNRLEFSLALSLSATLIWTYPSVSALAVYVLSKLDMPAEGASPGGAPAAAGEADASARMAELQELSDEEKTALLDEKLAALEALLQ